MSFSKNKTVIVKAVSALDLRGAVSLLGKGLFTEAGRKAGRVQDVFGPVKSPYLSVRPIQGAGLSAGEDVFLKRGING